MEAALIVHDAAQMEEGKGRSGEAVEGVID
jgi:hypothetical protein